MLNKRIITSLLTLSLLIGGFSTPQIKASCPVMPVLNSIKLQHIGHHGLGLAALGLVYVVGEDLWKKNHPRFYPTSEDKSLLMHYVGNTLATASMIGLFGYFAVAGALTLDFIIK